MAESSAFPCPTCGTPLEVGAAPGKLVKCPKCGKKFRVPATDDTLHTPPPTATDDQTQPANRPAFPTMPGYEILDELGRGGMGVVYKARQTGLNRVVALKMILSAEHAGADEMKRFRIEAEAVAQLQHPNIVQVYEIGEHNGRPYFSMEFVEGGSLQQRIGGKPQPPKWCAAMAEKLALAMHAAHAQGIIHRDLKPANVLLCTAGVPPAVTPASRRHGTRLEEPRIMDFGLAKRLKADESLTQSGAVMGTPQYMAPEQASGEARRVGPLADVYALGAILYTMLTGKPPFSADTAMAMLRKVLNEEPAPPTALHKRIPPDIETICLKCLQKEPAKRYASANELAADLRRFLNGEPIVARASSPWEKAAKWARRSPTAAALIGVSALATVGVIGLLVRHDVQQRSANAELRAALDAIEQEKQRVKQAEDERRRANLELTKERRTPDEKEKEVRDAERIKAQQRFKKALAAGKALELDLGGGVKLEMMLIPAGKFIMGSPEMEKDRGLIETQHEATIGRPFYMGMYEVTQEQYEQVMGKNRSLFKAAQNPADSVPWDAADEYCRRLSGITRQTVRLPTEAEWEYACRAGTTTRFNTGDGDGDLDRAGWWQENSWNRPHPVGGKEANAWGLYDMHGNVREWCQDWYAEYQKEAAADPFGPAHGTSKVLRGGWWGTYRWECRSAHREWHEGGGYRNEFGFRIVIVPKDF